MSDWQPIETAPKDGTFVLLRSEEQVFTCPFWWNKKLCQWDTLLFAPLRKIDAWWDEEAEEQPTHWAPVDALKSTEPEPEKVNCSKRL